MFTTLYVPPETRTFPRKKRRDIASTPFQWHDLFVSHSEALSSVARILTEGPCSSAVVLFNAEYQAKLRDIPEEFMFRYAIRTVVLAALVMPSLEACPDGFDLFDGGTPIVARFEDHMATLPYRERCVVFLRDVLGYSRRETGLLLCMCDSQVDDLLYLGRNRLFQQDPAAIQGIKHYFEACSSLAHDQAIRDAFWATPASGMHSHSTGSASC